MDGTFAGTPPALALGLRWLGSPFVPGFSGERVLCHRAPLTGVKWEKERYVDIDVRLTEQ